ncbi:LamG-like jellyroll fold domain-containing protein, partial [Paraclostridium dentum]|uniref:LamG-like jellyroll fold domain-containing protein n=1 Tax=Paraclostridium dentum TaxID=2662455 RepID=UPI00147679BE
NPEMDKISTAVTVCVRAFSDLPGPTYFSLALPSQDNGFVIWKVKQTYSLSVLGQVTHFLDFVQDNPNGWNSVCVTWDSITGLAQFWVNGFPSSRKGCKAGSSLTGTPKIILGQEQDSYGGGFDIKAAFVGMLTDVHMWDSVLSPGQIAHYSHGGQFKPGNVINWNSLDYSINGYVIVESKETSYKVCNSHNV